MFFFVGAMVRLRYHPNSFDLNQGIAEVLRQIWNFNSNPYKQELVDGIAWEEWAIELAKKKWLPDFVDFNFAITKIRANDRTFIDFDDISILDTDEVLFILRQSR